MDSFLKNWFQFQLKFLPEDDDSNDPENKTMICFVYNFLKICKFFHFDLEHFENDIISFVNKQVDYDRLGLSSEENQHINKFLEDDNTLLKGLHYIFLSLMEKHFCKELKDILEREDIFHLKSYFQKIDDGMAYQEKKKQIDFILSSWKPKSILTVFEDKPKTYVINSIQFQGEVNDFIKLQLIDDQQKQQRMMYLTDYDVLNALDSKSGEYKTYSYFLESSYPVVKMPIMNHYFEFYLGFFQSLNEFQTNYKNKDLIKIFRLKIDLIMLKIQLEKELLSKVASNNVSLYQSIQKKSKRLLSFVKLEENPLDYYYLLGEKNNIKNIYHFPKEKFKYYFKGDIIVKKNNQLWLKNDTTFYEKFDLIEECSDLVWYKNHNKLRNENYQALFIQGVLKCPLTKMTCEIATMINHFIEKMAYYNIISFEFQNQKLLFHFEFPYCNFEIEKEQMTLSQIAESYFYHVCNQKKKILIQIDNLKTSKKKKIKILDGQTISYEDEIYFWGDTMISHEEIRKKLDELMDPNIINLRMVFDSFGLSQDISDLYLQIVYKKTHDQEPFEEFDALSIIYNKTIKKESKQESCHFEEQKQIIRKMNRQNEIRKKQEKIIEYLDQQQMIRDFTNDIRFYS